MTVADKALPQMPNFILYTSPSGDAKVDVVLQDEILMTQKAMEALFNVSKSTLSGHLRNIFESGDLSRETTVRNFRTDQKVGA